MIPSRDREDLSRMRDALADRMHFYEDQVSYGNISLEEKHRALTEEFGPDWRETLSSMNQLLHEKEHTRNVLPHGHATFVVAVLAVGVVLALILANISPTLTGQAVVTSWEVDENNPVRLHWQGITELMHVEAEYLGEGEAQLMIQDARGEHVLVEARDGAVTCEGCPLMVYAPVLVEMRGEGRFIVHAITMRKKT